MFTIGRLAAIAKVTIDTLRHYEREGLLRPSDRSATRYRLYDERSLRCLYFIRHAQECGFSLAEIRQVLDLKKRDAASCRDVSELLARKKQLIDEKIDRFVRMRRTFDTLSTFCMQDATPIEDCPLFAALESPQVNGLDDTAVCDERHAGLSANAHAMCAEHCARSDGEQST